ncbi:nuclease-related domain-containing protein [Muribaculum intestinale]|uniref:nuclease-related domain-containing protein n=1 Tax=Muribaculum intestinale TaxID=1796646 RepID=UPI0020CC7924|nr:nuclease-related domain-containing protein [Muribaculum intestinale]
MPMTVMFGFISVLALIIAIFFAIYKWRKSMALLRTVTETHRGTWSERKLVLKLLKHDIPAITVYHDLYVERHRGQYSQIDAVVVTKVGIIVFEVKDYSGWIFGKGYQNYWTQVLAYGKEKHRFYNPILQNKGHIEALKKKLEGIAEVPFYSVSSY